MADIAINNITNSISVESVPGIYVPNLNLTAADLIRQSIVKLTTFNSNMSTEYQNGSYNTGFASDGSFVMIFYLPL